MSYYTSGSPQKNCLIVPVPSLSDTDDHWINGVLVQEREISITECVKRKPQRSHRKMKHVSFCVENKGIT
jgi:hypothetical protein